MTERDKEIDAAVQRGLRDWQTLAAYPSTVTVALAFLESGRAENSILRKCIRHAWREVHR